MVSAVYVRVKEGYTAEQVAGQINVHVRKVEAVETRSMLSGIADSLTALAGTARWLILLVGVLCAAILALAFSLMTGERRSEFALLRMLGYSRRGLMGLVLRESLTVSLLGAVLGIAAGVSGVCLFSGAIADQLSLPLMTPDAGRIGLICAATLAVTLIAGVAASMGSARRLSRTDTGILMREGH